MRTEDALRRLAPLLPERVREWRRSLVVVDADLRALIEKQIALTAQKHFGSGERLLLSLPPRPLARGKVRLGTVVYEEEKWPAGIGHDELVQNLAIFGRSGAGKTNLTFYLLQQLLAQGVPFVFLDWKRTARHLLPGMTKPLRVYTPGRKLAPFPFNPFVPPPGLETSVYTGQVVDVLADAYTLGDGAKSLLYKALVSPYQRGQAPTATDLQEHVQAVPDKERVRGWKISTIRALESLAAVELGSSATSQQSMLKALTQSRTVVELDGLSPSNKRFLLPLLCLWLYYVKLASRRREQLSLVVFVEEAHHVFYTHPGSYRETLMEMLLRQCRELGISIVVIDQHPSLISNATLGNTYTSICLNLKDPADIRKAGQLSGMRAADYEFFSRLPVGHGIVKLQDRWRQPFLITIPHVRVAKGSVTDALLKRYQQRDLTLSGLTRRVTRDSDGFGGFREPAPPLTPTQLLLVADVLRHPDDGVNQRYQRLAWSADKGNRTKKHLVYHAILQEELISIGRTRKLLLRVTTRAQQDLGLTPRQRHGGLAHTYWQHYYARKYEREGWKVQLEAPRDNGRADILARKEGTTLAIEIETGKSNAVKNVRENLRAGWDGVLVAVSNREAEEKVKRELGAAGLISSRVRIVRCHVSSHEK